jgi:Gamma-aminobutyrate permease and related permeases
VGELRRTIGLPAATLYGTGLILGAGIYAVIGVAIGATGPSVVFAFVIAAVVALFTGLSYADLSSRYPTGEAEYLYTLRAFSSRRLSELTALGRVATGVISAAAVALAFGGYLSAIFPIEPVITAVGLLGAATVINWWGIEASTRVNMVFTVIEISGLLLIIWIGVPMIGTVELTVLTHGWTGLLEASFLVFFAYIGFEALANLAEETTHAEVTIPRAIQLSLLICTVLYIAVAIAAVAVVDAAILGVSAAPLATVATAALGPNGGAILAVIALFATANTALMIVVSTSRVVYGVGKSQYRSLPPVFARVDAKHGTPVVAVMAVGFVAMAFALIGSLELVTMLTNLALLSVFVLVNAAAIKLHRRGELAGGYDPPLIYRGLSLTAVVGMVASMLMLGAYGFLLIA